MEEDDNVSYDLSDLDGDVMDGAGNAATVPLDRTHQMDLIEGNHHGSEGSVKQRNNNTIIDEDLLYDQQSLEMVKYAKSKSSMDEVKRYNAQNKNRDIQVSMQQFNDY